MPSTFFCRSVRFTASHHYELADETPAGNRTLFGDAAVPHEHDWTVTIWLTGPKDPRTGMVADLVKVDGHLQREIVVPFHGGHINDVDPFFQQNLPTTEVLAGYFFDKLRPLLEPAALVRLRVNEADDLFAEVVT